ncbi:MAG TPA: HD-GYP domain-containing protein, partial [Acidimicrobiales bacterium]|nr:HD-GYP domain-containing protein [Acidimicrobiales bacterium]
MTLVPVAASLAVGLVANRLLPVATTIPGAVTRSAGILLSSLPVLVVVDVVARRFLPLAALLQLSLVFPDQTPSRFRLALKAGSGRHMTRAVEEARVNGLSEIPEEGAEQLVVLATAIGDHDRRTRGHSERVRLYAELIGEALDLSPDERNKLQWAALIHDIGKVTVPPEILNKKGKPDETEWAILQAHPAAGEQLVGSVEGWLGEWVHAVGGHHEKWVGSGYPRGLAGADIPRAAAIVAVADSFEVMTAVRSYKKAMTLADARREMTRCAGKHFSPEVVRAFLNLSIGDLRRSMGLLAAVAHLPILGRLSTAASYAPDTISTAVSMTSTAATAGAGAVAVTASV